MLPIAITEGDRGNRFLFVRKLPTASIMPCKLTQQTSAKLKVNRLQLKLNILAKLQTAEKKGGPIL